MDALSGTWEKLLEGREERAQAQAGREGGQSHRRVLGNGGQRHQRWRPRHRPEKSQDLLHWGRRPEGSVTRRQETGRRWRWGSPARLGIGMEGDGVTSKL